MKKQITLTYLQECRTRGEKITCVTAYDATFATLLSEASVDVLLVGDSLGMVLHGYENTLNVTLDDMIYHTKAVAKGNRGSLIMSDMPFMAYKNEAHALDNASALIRAGAHMVKLEGGASLASTVALLTQWGIPVCAHVGLTPQWVNQFGGFQVQGRSTEQAHAILHDAKTLADAGAALIVLECVPNALAKKITEQITIPTIGIGAGKEVSGQVLVLHDLLGVTPGKRPRFTKNFLGNQHSIQGAVEAYIREVKSGEFPAAEHGFDA